MNLKIRDICIIALFTAVIAALSQVSIALPLGVPLSLQTFAVMLTAIILGAKKSVIAALVYLTLGLAGAPVFVNFGGGFHRIIGPWGGYLMSYPAVALVIGLASNTRKKAALILALTLGAFINLSSGTLWFAFVTEVNLTQAFAAAFAPFIPAEAVKIFLAFSIGVPARRLLKKNYIG